MREINMERMDHISITEMFDNRRVDAIVFNEWQGYPEPDLEPRYEGEPRVLRYIPYDLDMETNTWVRNDRFVNNSSRENTPMNKRYAVMLNYLYRSADGQHIYSLGSWGLQDITITIDCPRCGHWSRMVNNSRVERLCQDPDCAITWSMPDRDIIQPIRSTKLILHRTDGAGEEERRMAEVITPDKKHYVVSLQYSYYKGGYIIQVQKGKLEQNDNGSYRINDGHSGRRARHQDYAWITAHFLVKPAKRFGTRIWANLSMKNWHPVTLRVERLIEQLEAERTDRLAEDERRQARRRS